MAFAPKKIKRAVVINAKTHEASHKKGQLQAYSGSVYS